MHFLSFEMDFHFGATAQQQVRQGMLVLDNDMRSFGALHIDCKELLSTLEKLLVFAFLVPVLY